MRLSELLYYSTVNIQCHDNPDPDALAAAFGLYLYFKSKGVRTRILYGGRNQITKANLVLMIKELGIPVNYFPETLTKLDGLLLTVDCQYGQGNVSKLIADTVACIDHHALYTTVELKEVNSFLGSCSTLVWKMLRDEGFDVNEYKNLATALYYGLMTDTGNFVEGMYPLDLDMKDNLIIEKNMITRFTNSNISIKELEIAGIALIRHIYNDDHRFAVVHSEACDPNILGLISDLVLQVDKIDTCVVYNQTDGGFKISVRSCVKEVRANELAAFLTKDIGSGGGHSDKAGGFIFENLYEDNYPTINTETYFGLKMTEYFDSCEIIHAKDYVIDTTDMKKYKKKKLILGYADPAEFLPEGTHITVRTLEGDIETKVDNNFYIMIGYFGEVYPIKKEKFKNTYNIVDTPYECNAKYVPTVRNNADGEVFELAQYARACQASGDSYILAKKLDHTVKIFTMWDEEKYMLGNEGDYIACRSDDSKDVYVIADEIFGITYEEC